MALVAGVKQHSAEPMTVFMEHFVLTALVSLE